MNRVPSLATLVLVALVGCGEEKSAPAGPKSSAAPVVDAAKKDAAAAKQPLGEAKDAAAAAERDVVLLRTKKELGAQMGNVPFSVDWKAAMAQATASKKPLLFLFTEKASAEGAKLGAGAFKDPKVVEAAASFIPAIVDVDADAPLAERFGARTTPMVVYASPTGEVLGSTIASSDLLNDMKAALETLKSDAAENK